MGRYDFLPSYHFENNESGILTPATDRLRDYTITGNHGKNFVPYPYFQGASLTSGGITFTVSSDGTITANGTATGIAQYFITNWTPAYMLKIPPGRYLYGIPSIGKSETCFTSIGIFKGETQVGLARSDNSNILNLGTIDYDRILYKIYIAKGTTVDNVTLKPMIALESEGAEYEKYRGVGDEMANLISYPYYHKDGRTNAGITYNVSADGAVIMNGTSTGTTYFRYTTDLGLPAGTYQWIVESNVQTLPIGARLCFRKRSDFSSVVSTEWNYGGTQQIEVPDTTDMMELCLVGNGGLTVNDLQVRMRICKPGYVIPILNTTSAGVERTEIYRDTQLFPGKSINFKTDELPEILLRENMENVLTVGTEVSPSAVSYQYYKH